MKADFLFVGLYLNTIDDGRMDDACKTKTIKNI